MSSVAPLLSGGPFHGRRAWWPARPLHKKIRLPMRPRLSAFSPHLCLDCCTPLVAVYEIEDRFLLLPRAAGEPWKHRSIYVYVFKGME